VSQRNAPPVPPNSSDDDEEDELTATDEGADSAPELTTPGMPSPGYSASPSRGGRQFGKIPTPTTPFVPPHLAQGLNPQQIVRSPAAGRPAQESAPPRPPFAPAYGSLQGPPPTPPPLMPPRVFAPQPGAPPPPGIYHPTPPPTSGVGPVQSYPSSSPLQPAAAIRADVAPPGLRPNAAHVIRSRAYSFVLDARGIPIEIGSGRSAKAYLGEERWIESKTDFRRDVVIKILQKGITEEDHMRFQMEKELLERVQGHPNIVHLFASGEGEDPEFIPAPIRDKVDCEFVILERLEMSLEERLKGSRQKGKRDELLTCEMRDRIFRVLDYMIPIAAAVEYAHLVRNVCHRDIKPANVLIGLPNPNLRGAILEVRLADFNVAKLHDEDINFQMTRASMKSVPGTLFFQSPEQETNLIELLVNVTQGSAEVEFFEDFYIQIEKNDSFALFNRGDTYPILYADRAKKKIVLARPYRDGSESNVRAKVQKSVGRPADIYSIGAMLYYLMSGAYANPKTLYDNFHKFIEYERVDESNTIQGYLEHEYSVINSLRAPKGEQGVEVAPADRFFSYKHYLDGNGDLIDPHVMMIVARCMIRNKPDSYCQAHDIETRGISDVVQDMIDLYTVFGVHPSARPANIARLGQSAGGRGLTRSLGRVGNRLRWLWLSIINRFRRRR
jgi:serine/threonine protein kinase